MTQHHDVSPILQTAFGFWSSKVVIEALIDDARRENAFGLLMSLNMLIEFGEAFDYSGADFKGWCSSVGFKRFEVVHLSGRSRPGVMCSVPSTRSAVRRLKEGEAV